MKCLHCSLQWRRKCTKRYKLHSYSSKRCSQSIKRILFLKMWISLGKSRERISVRLFSAPRLYLTLALPPLPAIQHSCLFETSLMIFKAELLFVRGTWRWQTAAKTVRDFDDRQTRTFLRRKRRRWSTHRFCFVGSSSVQMMRSFVVALRLYSWRREKRRKKAFLAWKYLLGADYESIIQSLAALRDLKIDACVFPNKRFASSSSNLFAKIYWWTVRVLA